MSLQIEHISYRINGSLIIVMMSEADEVFGEIIGLIGPNGAGKSTLANVLSGFIVPSKGTAHFEGRSLIGIAPQGIARLGVARTFQGQHLPWNSTPRQCLFSVVTLERGRDIGHDGGDAAPNVASGNLLAQVEKLLARFGLAEASTTPARDLSFGQQRMLALAMACARCSRLLILDEPFAGLISSSLEIVLDVLRTEANTKAFIFIDHTLSAVREVACRTWFMHRGRLTMFRAYSEMAVSRVFLRDYLGATAPDGEPPAQTTLPDGDRKSVG